jgi:hypothetical protein
MYQVLIPRKVLRSIIKMPNSAQLRMANLVEDLRDRGPYQVKWPNYGRIGSNQYHCHLSYKWVACWFWKKGTIEIEVYYDGSRENAPY